MTLAREASVSNLGETRLLEALKLMIVLRLPSVEF